MAARFPRRPRNLRCRPSLLPRHICLRQVPIVTLLSVTIQKNEKLMSETLDINRSEEIRAGVIPEVRSVDHIGRALGGLFALIRFPVSEVERVQGVSLRDTDVPNLRASPLTREEFRAMALGDLVQHPRVNKNPGHLLLRTLQILNHTYR